MAIELQPVGGLGIVPDWRFYPQPPPVGTGKYSPAEIHYPGECPSYGISGALAGPATLGIAHAMFGQEECKLRVSPFWGTVGSILSIAGATTGAYHGYKRNDSVGWSIGWFFFGAFLPILSIPISIAQGFGQPK